MRFDLRNIGKYLSQREFWTKLGWTTLGAVAGEVLPAAIQGLSGRKTTGEYNIDMSGAIGNVASASLVATVGLAMDKPYVALGTLLTKGTKLLYVYGNPYIAKVFNSPIPPATKNSIQVSIPTNLPTSMPPLSLSDDVLPPAPAGMEYLTRPDGTKVLVSSGPSGETVNDSTPLMLEPAPVLNSSTRYGTLPLSDYSNNPFNLMGFDGASLNDEFDAFANAVAYGSVAL